MAKFSPFFVQFDKPTWGAVKDVSDKIGGGRVDAVIVAVRVAHGILLKPKLLLSEAGMEYVTKVVQAFRSPIPTIKDPRLNSENL